MVAMSRLALKDAGAVPISIEVDWSSVWAQARAGRADVWRRSSRRGAGDERPPTRPRRATVEDVERNIRAAGFEPQEYRPRMSIRSAGSCLLSQYEAARARPGRRPDLFTVRFDVPAQCAALLHEGRVDLGLIPPIEYLRGDYRIVPGVAIGSDGPIASVAVFSKVPIDRDRDARARHQLADVGRADAHPVRAALAHRAEARAGRARSAQHAVAGRCGARDRRSGARDRLRGTRRDQDRSRERVAGDDRTAVRLRHVVRP